MTTPPAPPTGRPGEDMRRVTDTPVTRSNPMEGLPELEGELRRRIEGGFHIWEDETLYRALLNAIAAIPAMEAEIERLRKHTAAADVLERVAAEELADPATDDLTITFAIRLSVAEDELARLRSENEEMRKALEAITLSSDGNQMHVRVSISDQKAYAKVSASCAVFLEWQAKRNALLTKTEQQAEEENQGGDPSTPELLKPRGNGGIVSADICFNAILLIATAPNPPTEAEIAAWTQEDRDRVYDWAIRVHLAAGDNDDVFVPPTPTILTKTEQQ